MTIHPSGTDTLVAKTAGRLDTLLAQQSGKEFLFLISGGSGLVLLDHIDPDHFGSNSTLGVLDERYSTDPLIHNFAQLENTEFYGHTIGRGAQTISTKVREDEPIEALALRFEKELRGWRERTGGIIIATIGIGSDAHTSGILPFPEDPELFQTLFDRSAWVTAYDAGDKNQYPLRVTTTLPFLRQIDHPIIFMSGENKKEAFAKLNSDEGTVAESPCRIWREVPHAEVYTDLSI